nr:unnamed protein product [Callosobruchus analis]
MVIVLVELAIQASFAKIDANRVILALIASKFVSAKMDIALDVTLSLESAFALLSGKGCDANQNARKASMVQTVRKLAFARTTVRAIQKRASATVPGDGKETIAASLVKKATMV